MKKKKQYERLRADTGQHMRILATSLVLGILAFIPIGMQLYNLMVVDFSYYSAQALRNQSRTTQLTPERGEIYDRNMNVLATSIGTQNIYLNPHELKQAKENLEDIGEKLGEVLNLEPGWIVQQGQDTTKRYKQIAARVDEETAAKIRAYIADADIAGIHLEPNTKRYYPYGSMAAQVIGFTNASNTGSEGVEASYNSYLEGAGGKVITTKGNNEMDMPFSYEKFVIAQKGCDVVLTLDATVQTCLEKQMQNAVDRYDVQNGAFGVVMNVNTGEILAMATLGSYDPNRYQEIFDKELAAELEKLRLSYLQTPFESQEYLSGKKTYETALTEARLKQWRNRVISDGYEPGSTFKVMTMAAALDCGAIDLTTGFHCSGAEQIPGRSQRLHCWRSTGHGAEQTPQALQNSCNIAFAHIALKLGGERFYDYVQRFGVLEKTGIDLAGESKGVFFDKALVTDTNKWGTASLTSGSFGQTFKLTPLQLVRGISAVVNGGKLLEPYIVSEVINSDGNTVLKQEPTVIRQVISGETSNTMKDLLRLVVTEGTAKNANVFGFDVGGKTGTSEKIDVFDQNGQRVQDKIVSFVGIAPMDNPEYIVLVALDTPSRSTGIYISGGVMAAPTVGAVLSDILPYLGVAHNYGPEDAAGKTVVLENMVDLTADEAKKKLKEQGITAIFRGSGDTVTDQLPGPGSGIPGDSQVILYLDGTAESEFVKVPDFQGMTRQQAADLAGTLGLYILVRGNGDISPGVTAISQSISKDTEVEWGTTVTLTFADTNAKD